MPFSLYHPFSMLEWDTLRGKTFTIIIIIIPPVLLTTSKQQQQMGKEKSHKGIHYLLHKLPGIKGGGRANRVPGVGYLVPPTFMCVPGGIIFRSQDTIFPWSLKGRGGGGGIGRRKSSSFLHLMFSLSLFLCWL